jgi:FkbM family methyltransferase
MKTTDSMMAVMPRYIELLGMEQALKLMNLFSEIEAGKYERNELHQIKLKGIKHPFYIRAIRADMQSFINTFIDSYLTKKPYMNDCRYVIDAGANIGYTAILFANWWPESKIISIEPDNENYEFTLINTKHYPNITVLNAGLWNKEIDLKIEAGQEDGFVVREIEKGQHTLHPENLTKGISIDQIMTQYQFPRIDFLKMNIEGSEKEVFQENFENWLPQTKVMLIELHDGKNSGCSSTVFQTTNQYDFSVTETASYGVLFAKEDVYRKWYATWYREEIYKPNIDKDRFPKFYLNIE